MIKYPEGPVVGSGIKPGEGININPVNQVELLNFTTPIGLGTKGYYVLSIWLSRMGYENAKIDEWVFVSPSNKPYYDMTIGQREELQLRIKQHLVSIATAITDLELAQHDLRKYKEYMSYYEKIERGKKLLDPKEREKMAKELMKKGKKLMKENRKEGEKLLNEAKRILEKGEEEGKKLFEEGNQTLRSIFVDMVDAHTDLPNIPIALRSIAARWPTIISDFMKLDDSDTTPEVIAKKLEVSEAEAVILATKNKLFVEWKNNLFGPTVKQRYQNLVKLVEARKASLREYIEMARPIIARYKMIIDALQNPALRGKIKTSFFRPDAQAFTIDFMRLWAWKPIAVSEKYRKPLEIMNVVPARKAGFTSKEIEYLSKTVKDWDGTVPALPVPKVVDRVLRVIIKKIEKTYGVVITPLDVYNAIKTLADTYQKRRLGEAGENWPFSPYFVFFDIPLTRAVFKMPNGEEIEDFEIKVLKTYVKTENVIVGHLLELTARNKVMEMEIGGLLGEFGFEEASKKWVSIQQILSSEFPTIFEEESVKEASMEKPEKVYSKEYKQEKILKKLKKFGLKLAFFRAKGPYEFAFTDRLTKFYFTTSGIEMGKLKGFLFKLFKVPV